LKTGAALWTPPFIVAFAANFLVSVSFFLFVHLPGFLITLGADGWMTGVLAAAMAVTAIAVRPILGPLMDRYGRRPVVIGGNALNVVACLLYLLVDSVGPTLFVARIVHGAAEAALFTVLFTIAADVAPAAQRTRGIAVFGVSGLLPVALAGGLGDIVIRHGGYTELFRLATVLAVLSLVITLPIGESRPPSNGEVRARFHTTVLQRNLLPIWVIGFGFSFGLASYFTFLKRFAVESSDGSVGQFFTAYAVAAVFLRIVFGGLPDRIGHRRVLFPSVGALAIGIVLVPFADTIVLRLIAGGLCGIGHGYCFPILASLVVTRARAVDRGAAMATFTALFDVGMVFGGLILGALSDVASYGIVFGVASLVVVATASAFAVWDQ